MVMENEGNGSRHDKRTLDTLGELWLSGFRFRKRNLGCLLFRSQLSNIYESRTRMGFVSQFDSVNTDYCVSVSRTPNISRGPQVWLEILDIAVDHSSRDCIPIQLKNSPMPGPHEYSP